MGEATWGGRCGRLGDVGRQMCTRGGRRVGRQQITHQVFVFLSSFLGVEIVLGHVIFERGIEVDEAKVETIEQLPPPTDVKSLKSFLGHAGFYRRFIKDSSKITKPLTHLLQKDVAFDFDEKCLAAFRTLKNRFAECSHYSTSGLEPTFRDHVQCK
jgi:hypothetical protein